MVVALYVGQVLKFVQAQGEISSGLMSECLSLMLDKSSHFTLAPDAIARSMLVQRVVAYHLLKRMHASSQNLYIFLWGMFRDPRDTGRL